MKSLKLRCLLAVLGLFAFAGCDGSSSASEDAGSHSEDGGPGTSDGPIFLLHSAVDGTESRTNYFTPVGALGDATSITYESAIEVPGRARLYAEPGIGFFAIGDGADVSITRYTVSDDGSFEAGDRLSLQPFGVTSMGAQAVLFVSATRAYYKDAGQAQVIVWNPTTMEVDDVIELPAELIRDGRATGFSAWASREGEAYFAVGWTTLEYDRVDEGTALVRIDTATNAVTVTNDDRCRDINKTAVIDGDLYFFSGVINGFGHAVYPDDGGQQDCILRVRSGETELDASYVGTMSSLLESHEIGTVIAVTEDGRAWAQVVDTNAVPTEPGTTYSEWYGGGWRWVSFDLASADDLVRVPGEVGAYSAFTFASGSNFFVAQTAADYSETTLVDLSGESPSEGITFPGFTLDVARLR